MNSANFASLLGDDYRQVFIDRASEVQSSSGCVQSQHVTMLDSSHGQVFLQLYYTKGETVTGTCFYLVGVKEDLESGWRAPSPNVLPITDMTPLSQLSKLLPESEPSEAQSESSAESMMVTMSSPAYSHVPLGEYPMLVWIEPMTEEYDIQKCSLSFQAQFGPLFAGTSLRSIIAKSHIREFERWFQSSCNNLEAGAEEGMLEVLLNIKRGGALTYKMTARLQLLDDGEPESEASELVMIWFQDVKLVRCKRQKRKGLIKEHRRSSREKKIGADASNSVTCEPAVELIGRSWKL